MIEDANSILAGLPQRPKINILLHQHVAALLGHSHHFYHCFVNKLSGIVFVSKGNRKAVTDKFGDFSIPAYVIYNGIDLNQYRFYNKGEVEYLKRDCGISPDSVILFFAGRVHHSKGLLELTLSLNLLQDLKIELLVAGDMHTSYDFSENYKVKIEGKIKPNIHLLGSINQKKHSEILCDMRFCCSS